MRSLIIVLLAVVGCQEANSKLAIKAKNDSGEPRTTFDVRPAEEPKSKGSVTERLDRIELLLIQKLEAEARATKAIVDYQACLDSCDRTAPYPKRPDELNGVKGAEGWWDQFWVKKAEKAHRECHQSCGKAPVGYQWEC